MNQADIWLRMAEKWREAADEVSVPALKRCYIERAASYDRLAAQNEADPAPSRRRPTRH